MTTLRMLALLGLVAAGCGPALPSTDDFWRPWYDDPSLDGGSVTDGPPTGGACTLKVTSMTATLSGKYAPDNVGAIWIDDGGGHFVKSLYVWGNRRLNHLNRWSSDTAAAGVPKNRVDAITAATLSSFGERDAQWNCTDYSERVVASGTYQVCFEITSSNSAGPVACDLFDVGKGAFRKQPADTAGFRGRVLEMTP